jgi:hypothetical protein
VFGPIMEFSGNEVDDAREGSWGRCPVGLALLSCYVPVAVDRGGLACPLV